jgi:predicted enzyme related to lactoylglutathione lyase
MPDMTSRLAEICVDCSDPHRLAAFWAEALGWQIGEANTDDVELVDPERQRAPLLFLRVPERKTVKNRLHLDLSPRDRDQEEEVDRLIALGAHRVDVGQNDVSWVVLADIEGNEFCVLRTRQE